MVYYRKYRPQTIDDLDNAGVRETLASVLQKGDTHAFLFTGPKGLGKTSTARIIAKVVNCEKRAEGTIEPCNQCQQCVSITAGTNMDVLEIDAASNRGIDEIRDLKEKIRLSPVAAVKKVYIIDEVHMLTTEAFNALLKTLEEPPSHAMFVLCTTEPHKVPATIISRCFHFSFHLATTEELVRSFKRIVQGEKINIDDVALTMIAALADGGFRDGAKILEEIVSLAGGQENNKDVVEEKYQVTSIQSHIVALLEVLKKQDTKGGIEIVSKLVEQGVAMKYFLQELMNELHADMLVQVGVVKQEAKSKKHGLSLEEITLLFALLAKAYTETKLAVLQQLPLELAIIAYCHEDGEEREEIKMTKVKQDSGVTVSSLRKQVGTIKKIQALYGEKPAAKEEKKQIATATVQLMHAAPNGEVAQEWLDHFWQQLIGEMKNHNHTIAGLLRGCRIASYDKKLLIIQTSYTFHKERLDDLKTRSALIAAVRLLTGKDVEVRVELGK